MPEYREIENPREISKLNKVLSVKLARELPYAETRTIGFPGGAERHKVRFQSRTDNDMFYFSTYLSEDKSTAINLFGHGVPISQNPLYIDVQFNLPVVRFSRRTGGTFLRHIPSNSVVMAHRGITTLGHGRVSKYSLFSEMAATIREAETSKGTAEFLLIGELESSTLVYDIATFSSELWRAKGAVGSHNTSTTNSTTLRDKLRKYFDEFVGKHRLKNRRRSVADCYHGTVVRAIRDVFHDADETLKNQAIDLTIIKGKRVYLFEAKTSSNTQSVYTAIGQLITHTQVVTEYAPDKTLVRVIVLPESPNQRFCNLFKDQLDIRLLTFTRSQKGGITIHGLDQLK
jgi:hypothetical protein